MKKINIIISFSLVLLCGCSTMSKSFIQKDVYSDPPATKIVLKEDYKGSFMMVPYTLPAGTYFPERENNDGFFFESPNGINISDYFYSRNTVGGIYWRKDYSKPMHIYYGKGEFLDILRDEELLTNLDIYEEDLTSASRESE